MSESTDIISTSSDSTEATDEAVIAVEQVLAPENSESATPDDNPVESSTETAGAKSEAGEAPAAKQEFVALPANLLTTAVSITWIAVFIYQGAAGCSLPWCITLASIAVWALSTTKRSVRGYALAASKIGIAEEGRLNKAFSTTYLSVSLLFFMWFFLHGFKPPTPIVAQKQFIDIELTSFADYKDNNELTASTEDKDSQRKRSGSTDKVAAAPPVVRQASAVSDKASQKTEESGRRALQSMAPRKLTTAPTEMVLKGVQLQSPMNTNDADIKAQQQKAEEKARFVSQVKLPSGWKSLQSDQSTSRWMSTTPGVKSELSKPSSQAIVMEEASPVELFEVVDNEGDKSLEIYQAGGRSSGGKGAPSTLQDYLKTLHKRIKRAWTPPSADPRVTQILFRITKVGKLKQIKLVRSSGNAECDEAAMSAITACAPFRGLPADFPYETLDVKYTFNYKVDSLSEVPKAEVE